MEKDVLLFDFGEFQISEKEIVTVKVRNPPTQLSGFLQKITFIELSIF